MKKVIVLQIADKDYKHADHNLFTCNECNPDNNTPCYALLPPSSNTTAPFGCLYVETDRASDIVPDWKQCNGNFQIING